MPRKTRAQMQAETREKLLDSALAAFGQKGFASATIDEIAEGAGFSRGAFYSNFASKEDLAVALMDREMRLDTARIGQIALAAKGSEDTVATRLRLAFPKQQTLSSWELFRLEMMMLAQRNPDFAARCREMYATQRQRTGELLRQLFALVGRRPPADEEMLAFMTMSIRLGAALMHEAAGPVPTDEIADLLFRAFAAIAPASHQADVKAA